MHGVLMCAYAPWWRIWQACMSVPFHGACMVPNARKEIEEEDRIWTQFSPSIASSAPPTFALITTWQ
jgi:hypothetical protein